MLWNLILRPCLAGNISLLLTTNGRLFGAVFPTGGRYGFVMINTSLWFYRPRCAFVLIAPLVDLLLLPFERSSRRHSFLCQFERYDLNKLSSEYFVLCLLHARALTSHNFKLWILFAIVGTLSYALPSRRRECLSLTPYLRLFPRSFYACRRLPLRF